MEPDGALDGYKVGCAEEEGVVVTPPQLFLQLPKSPGKHREQGVLFLTHEQRRHFAEPLHRQHRGWRRLLEELIRKSIKVNWLLLWEITPILYLAGPHSQGDLRDVPADSELTKNDRHKR